MQLQVFGFHLNNVLHRDTEHCIVVLRVIGLCCLSVCLYSLYVVCSLLSSRQINVFIKSLVSVRHSVSESVSIHLVL